MKTENTFKMFSKYENGVEWQTCKKIKLLDPPVFVKSKSLRGYLDWQKTE